MVFVDTSCRSYDRGRSYRLICLASLVVVAIGCSRPASQTETPGEESSPLSAMHAAMRSGDWKTAGELSGEVLIAYPDDPEIIAQVALVAHNNQQPEMAADLLVDAARTRTLADQAAVHRAVTGLISVGRAFDGIDLLSEAVRLHPDQDESRRWLFDFLVIFERHREAVPHGRILVQRRQFDAELLVELSNTEKRDLENDSLAQLVQQNPADLRPLIGEAKDLFDDAKLSKAEAVLRKILESHPRFLPAQLLLGRTLADSGSYEDLTSWSDAIAKTNGFESEWSYWMVVGDWARYRGEIPQSARAYWEASQCNPDVALVWASLVAALRQLPQERLGNAIVSLPAAERRANLLSQMTQEKVRFERSARTSRLEAANVASTLNQLGRRWEAEAWASIAMGLQGDSDGPEVDVESLRKTIVSQLRRDTPWQVMKTHPELTCQLSQLPKPLLTGLNNGTSSSSLYPVTVASMAPDLRNESTQRGLTFFGRTRDDLDQPGVPIYAELGCGGGVIDFDLDGWSDLYLTAAGGTPPHRDSEPNTMWRSHEGHFVNVGSASSTGDTGFGQGVSVGDLNEDGFPDLLVMNYGQNIIYLNNGDGTFQDVSGRLLPERASRWSTSGAIADVDGDGLSDFIVLNYCAGLDPVTDSCVDEAKGIVKSCAPIYFAAEADAIFHNVGDGTFVDATEDWGFQPAIVGRGLGLVVGSLDETVGSDIFIANDMSNNHYYNRASGGSFRLSESAISRGLATDDRSNPQASMGIAVGDLDRDGDVDFYITNFEDEYNTFHQQTGNGIWIDRTVAMDLSEPAFPMVGFGTEAVDLDNDGLLELVVANGHVDFPTEESESDYWQPMQIFHRNTSGRFSMFANSSASEYLSSNHAARALWTIDVDRDGRTDLVVSHQTEPIALLVNHTPTDHHTVSLRLVGRGSARDAIGAVVRIKQEGQNRTAFLISGDGYLGSNERIIRFGLGQNDSPVESEITWPDGSTQTLRDLRVNREWIVVQGEEPFEVHSKFRTGAK